VSRCSIPPASVSNSNSCPVSHSLHGSTHVPIAISEGRNNIHSDDYIKNHLVGDGEKLVPPKTFFRGASATHHNHMDRHLNDLISCTETTVGEPVAAVGRLHDNNNSTPPVSEFAKTMRATMTEKYSSSVSSLSSSKLPPKIPTPKTYVDNSNWKPSSRQSLLPYPLSHQSTLSQAGKRTFGKSGSPSEGGGSLSTNIAVGITEDLSRLTKPSLGSHDSSDGLVGTNKKIGADSASRNRSSFAHNQQQDPHSLPLTSKNIVMTQQYRQQNPCI